MPSKLGQNFLRNKDIVKKIVDSADLKPDDLVLEIGPGYGILTEELVKKARKVVAVEIDKNLVEFLKNKFKDNKKIEIVEGDILKINGVDLISNFSYKVIANLPYYITSPIIRMFLEAEIKPKEMILMVQKEVAERIVATPGQHSLLSLSVQYYAQPEILFYVPKIYFDPVPGIDSAVIRIAVNSKQKPVNKKESDNFFRVVRAGFSAKRKTLINNLSNSFHMDKKELEEKLKSTGISPTARAQELSPEDWKKLAKVKERLF